MIDAFSERFDENLKNFDRYKEAFNKTNEDMGFVAYKSYSSFLTSRKRKKKK